MVLSETCGGGVTLSTSHRVRLFAASAGNDRSREGIRLLRTEGVRLLRTEDGRCRMRGCRRCRNHSSHRLMSSLRLVQFRIPHRLLSQLQRPLCGHHNVILLRCLRQVLLLSCLRQVLLLRCLREVVMRCLRQVQLLLLRLLRCLRQDALAWPMQQRPKLYPYSAKWTPCKRISRRCRRNPRQK